MYPHNSRGRAETLCWVRILISPFVQEVRRELGRHIEAEVGQL